MFSSVFPRESPCSLAAACGDMARENGGGRDCVDDEEEGAVLLVCSAGLVLLALLGVEAGLEAWLR